MKSITQSKNIPKQRLAFDQQNLEAARIILADVQRHGDEQAGLVLWARMTVRGYLERTGQLRLRGAA